MKKIILVDEDHSESIADMRICFNNLKFIYERDKEIKSHLGVAIRELHFSYKSYKHLYNEILNNNSTSRSDHYISELSSSKSHFNGEIELEITRLSYFFKTYLVFLKSVLDKTIPFINSRYRFSDKTFERRGKKLITFLRNKYSGPNKLEIIKLIETNQKEWLEEVLTLRDNFVHYSSLNHYSNYTLPQNFDHTKVSKLTDFEFPSIEFKGSFMNAIEFLDLIHHKLYEFLNSLLMKFGYDKYYRTEFKTECNKCKFEIAKWFQNGAQRILKFTKPTTIALTDEAYDHGIVVCPNCGRSRETTLTELIRMGVVNPKLVK